MWAPDISCVDGEYRLYYAVSAFGKTSSAIGLSVNKTLDDTRADYRWIDRGKVIETPAGNNWNAIDPCAFDDADGNNWMVLGSCWTGLKLVQLDRKSGLLADPKQPPISIAAYPPGNLIEEGYIRRHGEFYYLWESVDHCCRGAQSTYRILVGRSKTIRGPYIDRDGKPMIRGGGTLVLASYDDVRGPGSCAIIPFAGHDFLIHHEYDAANRGTPTLQIRRLFWADDGWPVTGEPIERSPAEKPAAFKSLDGRWSVRTDFLSTQVITLEKDGTVNPNAGTWSFQGGILTIKRAKAAHAWSEKYGVADDASYFVGRDNDGKPVTATRVDLSR